MATVSDRVHAVVFRFASWLWLPLIEAVGQAIYQRGRLHATLMAPDVAAKRARRRVFSVTRRKS